MKFNPGKLSWQDLLLYKQSQFQRYRLMHGLESFVETGTNSGDSVEYARHIFKNVYSVELDPNLYTMCETKFKGVDNVHLLFGDSEIELEKLMDTLPHENILFWLDAHALEGELPAKHAFSGFIELENLLKRSLKNCMILVDDIYCPEFYSNLMAVAPDADIEMGIGRITIKEQGENNG